MKTECPASTLIHRRMPKEAFYKYIPLTTKQKNRFISDVDRIFAEYSFTSDNLHLPKKGNVNEILVILVELKSKNYSTRIIEVIARQNPHKLIFIMRYADKEQMAVFFGKLYKTEWKPADNVVLEIKGFSLDEVWENLVEQIALVNEEISREKGKLSLEERLKLQNAIEALEKKIDSAESAAWKETQPKKKYSLYTKLQQYKKDLEDLKDGKNENADS